MGLESSNKVVFLLGAGASIPAGMPTTRDISCQVVTGQGYVRSSDETFYPGKPMGYEVGLKCQFTPRVVQFIQILIAAFHKYARRTGVRDISYEDLFYLANRIHDSEVGILDDPTVQTYVDSIRASTAGLLRSEIPGYHVCQLHELATMTCEYIRDVVWHKLSKCPEFTEAHNLLIDACRDTSRDSIDIVTLNHDLLIERSLAQSSIIFVDGFGEGVYDVQYWTPSLLDTDQAKVTLLKPHGSIDWFYCYLNSSPREYVTVKIRSFDPVGPLGRGNVRLHYTDYRPLILTGTYNKLERYSGGVYFDLQYHFYGRLHRAKDVVVAGYGFGDNGINSRILDWAAGSRDRYITLIHPNPNKLYESLNYGVSRFLFELRSFGRLREIDRGIEQTTWDEIRSVLH
ncbi:MAG: SIR2 family protein [Candidatus Zixiibacteriota bacterium]